MIAVPSTTFRLPGIHSWWKDTGLSVFCIFILGFGYNEAGGATNASDVLIGTYTSGKSKGIYSFRLNADTGDLQPLGAPTETVNPSYLVVSPDDRFVYSVNELHGCGDQQGAVSAFRFDAASGALSFINSVPSLGDDPCYVSISPDGKDLFIANYSSGSLSAIAMQPDGSLSGPVETLTHLGHGPNTERQKAPHVHMVLPAPDHKLAFATDLGNDRLYAYDYQPESETFPLHPAEPPFTAVPAGVGPRHFAFGQNGQFLYLIEEMGQAIIVFHRDGARLDPIQTVRVAAKDWPGDTGAAAIHLSPDGGFLYASNRADANDLTIYAIEPQAGTLTPSGHQSSMGKKPRDFGIDPTGQFLLVANQDSDSLVVFRRDLKTGALTFTGKTVEIGSPVCVQIVSIIGPEKKSD